MGGGALKSEIHDRDNFSQGTAFLLLAKKMEQFYLISFNACSRKDWQLRQFINEPLPRKVLKAMGNQEENQADDFKTSLAAWLK